NCGPGQYFAFPDPAELDITRIREISPTEDDLVVLGGGGMLGIFDAEMEIARSLNCRKVIWGVGGNVVDSDTDDYDTSWADLNGRRDPDRNWCDFVPCVSCMNPVWDMDVPVVREWTEIEHHSV